ncbi:FeoB-associated Cys-rich membrane protein [Algoriphagus sp. YJ13C]|uniref:FeoB-associated Cys-rich membrane protein n=1 Tax=Algoriphagus pacificus TaxID=2811234 RepID=A0ABS3CHC1_9BACT|nr:FeoB-associated Cys-rich membrane protein [Algoriphagus pacificus]
MVQEILVGLLVLGALVFLGRKFFGKTKTQPGCDKCAKN